MNPRLLHGSRECARGQPQKDVQMRADAGCSAWANPTILHT